LTKSEYKPNQGLKPAPLTPGEKIVWYTNLNLSFSGLCLADSKKYRNAESKKHRSANKKLTLKI
jgi:hypothetical protein